MMKNKKIIYIAILVIVVLIVSTYFIKTDENKGLTVTTSFYPPADFAQVIGGELLSVVNINPPGSDPHSFEPTPRDITRILNSDIFIYYGAGIDTWAERIADEARKNGVLVIEMTKNFELDEFEHDHDHHDEHGHGHDDDHGHSDHKHESDHHNEDGHGHDDDHEHHHSHDHSHEYDPHIWLDPLMAIRQVEIIRDAIISIDPENTETYIRNAEEYIQELEMLHSEYEQSLAQCEIRTIVVSHAAFHYLTQRYNLEMVAIAGLSTGTEPSLNKMREITEKTKGYDIRYIFFETLTSPKVAESIANEVGAGTLVLNPIEGLTRAELNSGENYLTVMENNLKNLKTALRCN